MSESELAEFGKDIVLEDFMEIPVLEVSVRVEAALAVAAADGEISDEEFGLLRDIAQNLGMSEAHFRGILTTQVER